MDGVWNDDDNACIGTVVLMRTGQGCEPKEETKEMPCGIDAGDEEQCKNFGN